MPVIIRLKGDIFLEELTVTAEIYSIGRDVHGILMVYWYVYCRAHKTRSYMVALSAALCTRRFCVSNPESLDTTQSLDNSDRIKQSGSGVDVDRGSMGRELGVRLP